MNIKNKIASSVASCAIFMSVMATPALADTSVIISGNGAGSDNFVNVETRNSTSIQQSNIANISNNVSVNANTGNNESNFNTGGHSLIVTGDANTHVGIHNFANQNVVSLGEYNNNHDQGYNNFDGNFDHYFDNKDKHDDYSDNKDNYEVKHEEHHTYRHDEHKDVKHDEYREYHKDKKN